MVQDPLHPPFWSLILDFQTEKGKLALRNRFFIRMLMVCQNRAMKLPNREMAYVPPSKLEGYLLAETHTAGRSKAKFFRGIGFNKTTIEELSAGLLRIAQECDVAHTVSSPHGTKYIIDGSLSTPTSRVVFIRTIWIIDTGLVAPRFVTAYPQERLGGDSNGRTGLGCTDA